MRWWWLAALAGCSFERSDGASSSPDAVLDIDAPPAPDIDAPPPVPRCTVHATGDTDERDSVGGGGGAERPDLVCPANELPIGAEFETSVNTLGGGFNNQRAVVHIHIRCGRIERTPDNVLVTTPTERLTRAGMGCADPVAASGEQLCPAGAVLTALHANESGGGFSSINSIQLDCAALTPDGTVTQTTSTLDFRPMTGTFTNDPEASTCPEDQAVVAIAGKSGCTQDQMSAICARLTCD